MSSIYTALIGSFHRHLGLVPISIQYEFLSEVPYIRLPRPPPLLIYVHQLPHVVQTEQAHHKELVCLFNKSNPIKQAFEHSIDPWLSIHKSRFFLAILQEEEKVVGDMAHDPKYPVDVIVNKVEDLLDPHVAAYTYFIVLQLINIAYIILKDTRKYQMHIKELS